MFSLASALQTFGSQVVSLVPDYFSTYETKEIDLDPHPLIKLYYSHPESTHDLFFDFFTYCPTLADSWEQEETSLKKAGLAEHEDLTRDLVEIVAVKFFKSLSEDQKNQVHGSLYKLARPGTQDPEWGKNHCFDDIPLLINALQYCQLIESPPPLKLKIWVNETHLSQRTCYYELDGRPNMKDREICYINGIGTSFDDARGDAYKISDALCRGLNIRCIYNATHTPTTDMINTLRVFDGKLPRPILKLLKKWAHFFHLNLQSDRRFLQICYSQGAAMVEKALEYVPVELRCRIQVIAIAPAAFIRHVDGCQVIHFVKNEDIYPNAYALGRDRLLSDDPEIVIVPHTDLTLDPHNPHCSNYTTAISPYIDNYLDYGTIEPLGNFL